MNLNRAIAQLASGDRKAFKYIYSTTYKMVYYTALSVLKDRDSAEDACQTAYLKIIANASSFKSDTNAFSWILTIVKNEAINIRKKRQREVLVDVQQSPEIFGTDSTDDYGIVISIAKQNLSEDEFNILMLVAVSGYKRREIAKMLGIPTSTVTWKYNNATTKLKKLLKKEDE